MISIENIFSRWDEYKRGKTSKPDVIEFEFNLEDNIFRLQGELKNQTYKHDKYEQFQICDPKYRVIHKAAVKGRLAHHLVFKELYKIFDPTFFAVSPDGTFERERELKGFSENKKGIPIGNLTSQIFANIFLDKLDWFIKKELKIKNYFRYADDFAIVHPNSVYLEEIVGVIGDFLKNKLDLELHPQKVEIRKFSQGIDFLGYIILPHYTILRTKTKRRMFKKMKNKKKMLDEGLVSEESYNQSLQSYFGILNHCEGYGLSEEFKMLAR